MKGGTVPLLRLEGFTDFSALLRSGIYALCKRGVVIYVGKSKSLYVRIYTHRNLSTRGKGKRAPAWLPAHMKGIAFDEVWVQPCRLEDLDRLEAEAINRYKPHYNTNLKNTTKVSIPANLLGHLGVRSQTSVSPRPQILRRA